MASLVGLDASYSMKLSLKLPPAGTFGGLPDLSFVSLRDNQLSTLPGEAVILGGHAGGLVYLQNNGLTQVAPNALTGIP